MNVLNEIQIAAPSPPPPKAESPKPADGDKNFQDTLDVKLKAVQETQKKTAEQEKGTDASTAGAAAVTPLVVPVVIQPDVLKLAEQLVSTNQDAGTNGKSQVGTGMDLSGQNILQVSITPVKVENPVIETPKIVEQTPGEAEKQAGSKFQMDLNAVKMQTNQVVVTEKEVESAPIQKPSEMVSQLQTEPKKAVIESSVTTDNKVQVLAFNNALSALSNVNKQPDVQSTLVMQQVSHGIKDMVESGHSTLRLQIYPENLGRIEVKLVTGSDGMQVTLTADKSSTNRLLETNLSQLQQSLMNAGVKIGGMTVGQQNNQNGTSTWQPTQSNTFAFANGLSNDDSNDGTSLILAGSMLALDTQV